MPLIVNLRAFRYGIKQAKAKNYKCKTKSAKVKTILSDCATAKNTQRVSVLLILGHLSVEILRFEFWFLAFRFTL